jgi:hypothetical protein
MGIKEDQLRQQREAQFERPKASKAKQKLPEKNLPPGVKKGLGEIALTPASLEEKGKELGFDRDAYQREYMRVYMKDVRAAKRLGLSLEAYRERKKDIVKLTIEKR